MRFRLLALVSATLVVGGVALAQTDPPPTPGVGGGAGPTYGGAATKPVEPRAPTNSPTTATPQTSPSPGGTIGQGSQKPQAAPPPGGSFGTPPKR